MAFLRTPHATAATMFYDLNIPWPAPLGEASDKPQKGVQRKDSKQVRARAEKSKSLAEASVLSPAQEKDLHALLVDASELGYHTIAFNFIVHTRFEAQVHQCRFPPLASGQPSPPFARLDPRCQLAAAPSSIAGISSPSHIAQLTRLTLVMDDTSLGKSGHGLTINNQAELVKYDLLSAQPFNDASFSHVCLAMTELKPISIDIISIDAASAARTPFFMKRSLVNAAIANGAVFEICYSSAVSSSSPLSAAEQASESSAPRDAQLRARRNIIAVTRDLLRVSNGKGIIISSGAADIMGLRGPYDVINLACVFGMNTTAARDAISSTCRSLLLRAETRKTYRGVTGHPVVVSLVPHSPNGLDHPTKNPAGASDAQTSETISKHQNPAKRKQSLDNNADTSNAGVEAQKKRKKR